MTLMYRIGWLGFCGVVAAGGAVGAVSWEPSVLALLFGVAAVTGGMIALVVLNPEDTRRPPRELWKLVAKSTLLAGAGTIVFIGLGSLLGAATSALVAILVIGGSPYVVPYWIGWFDDRDEPPMTARTPAAPVELLPQEPVEPLSELTDEALCLAWRASFSGLERAPSAAERMRVVEDRLGYLDELVRRHPDAIDAWLASNPRAAGDPTRFVRGDTAPGHHPIDWNALIQGKDT